MANQFPIGTKVRMHDKYAGIHIEGVVTQPLCGLSLTQALRHTKIVSIHDIYAKEWWGKVGYEANWYVRDMSLLSVDTKEELQALLNGIVDNGKSAI
jgi:hypothetical protein